MYIPRSPLVSSVSPNKPERLAYTQQQINIVKTGKPKFNSIPATLLKKEVVTLALVAARFSSQHFLENSTLLTDLFEHVSSKGRSDVYPLVDYFFKKQHRRPKLSRIPF